MRTTAPFCQIAKREPNRAALTRAVSAALFIAASAASASVRLFMGLLQYGWSHAAIIEYDPLVCKWPVKVAKVRPAFVESAADVRILDVVASLFHPPSHSSHGQLRGRDFEAEDHDPIPADFISRILFAYPAPLSVDSKPNVAS